MSRTRLTRAGLESLSEMYEEDKMITPSEANAMSAGEESAVEDRIDRAITAYYSGGEKGYCTISISLFNANRKTIESVLARYRAAGWKAEIVSDWRDGDYIEISA